MQHGLRFQELGALGGATVGKLELSIHLEAELRRCSLPEPRHPPRRGQLRATRGVLHQAAVQDVPPLVVVAQALPFLLPLAVKQKHRRIILLLIPHRPVGIFRAPVHPVDHVFTGALEADSGPRDDRGSRHFADLIQVHKIVDVVVKKYALARLACFLRFSALSVAVAGFDFHNIHPPCTLGDLGHGCNIGGLGLHFSLLVVINGLRSGGFRRGGGNG
mmetsp:Transcript_12174/g.28929  ORF Transcript_12174/g.28929 Transcript_12174/m.28929 type:complete len:218 (-) Transcript_12174:19-672(-)